ncbi:MAG: hypothetical protein ACI9GM_000884 [Salibacteraceae bacterium]
MPHSVKSGVLIFFMKKLLVLSVLIVLALCGFSQGPFSPPADSVGTTAIYKDSSIVAAWVQSCVINRGPQHVPNSSSPLATVGNEQSVYGAPDGDVLSLGDGGSVIIELIEPLANHPSYDFAVFENGLVDQGTGGHFLELAFVEVSSDGVNFYRFPNESLTPTDVQTNPFGYTNASEIHNLAGKYSVGYGTPFDLDDMDTVVGLDVLNITHIKIIDVVGSIDPTYASYDSYGRMVNDPFPTSFTSGGFDLDAVAIVDSSFITGLYAPMLSDIIVYPNPVQNVLNIDINDPNFQVTVLDLQGRAVLFDNSNLKQIRMESLPDGIYFVKIVGENQSFLKKVIKL